MKLLAAALAAVATIAFCMKELKEPNLLWLTLAILSALSTTLLVMWSENP